MHERQRKSMREDMNKKMNDAVRITFEKTRKFIYRNARPLDLARWQYHFENGSKEAILSALSMYQNEDGGFGHGLEADCFNPASSPIQTWAATEILREIDFTDKDHPIMKGILKYLSSGKDFDTEHNQWLNAVSGNNDYPHAIWWEYKEDKKEFKYNPTACLAGFIIKYGDKDSTFYRATCKIAKEAYDYFMPAIPFQEEHVTSCFIRLYEYCGEADIELFDMEMFREKLKEQVNSEICIDVDKWGIEYVTMPSNFIRSRNSIFYAGNEEIIDKECKFITEKQCDDGSYAIPWQWWTDYKEFEIAENWWKSDFCIKNMIYLREFSGIEEVNNGQ